MTDRICFRRDCFCCRNNWMEGSNNSEEEEEDASLDIFDVSSPFSVVDDCSILRIVVLWPRF